MDARTVCKGVAAHDSLVGLHRHIHETAHHSARGINLCGIDVGLDTQVGVCLEYHGHLLKRGVSCSFSYAIDGHFHLSRSVEHTCYGVGCGHAQIIVTMGGQDGTAGCECIYMLV